jgi:tetratricopeptide (TPR) repeat protein
MESQQIAIARFKKKQYVESLRAFNEAIAIARNPQHKYPLAKLIALLDQRAACLEKLNKYPEALKNAREIISLDSSEPKGYLRAGKVMQYIGDRQRALKAYDLGLSRVSMNHHLRDTLKLTAWKIQQSLETKGENTKRIAVLFCDPVEVFPSEIFHEVLGYLPFQSIVCLTRVSKGWHEFITSSSQLWENLDFRMIKRKYFSLYLLRRYVTYATRTNGRLWSVNLPLYLDDREMGKCLLCLGTTAIEQLDLVASAGIMPAVLKPRMFDHLKLLKMQGTIDFDSLTFLLNNLGQLEWFDLLYTTEYYDLHLNSPPKKLYILPKLTTLILEDISFQDQELESLLKSTPNLINLCVRTFKNYDTQLAVEAIADLRLSTLVWETKNGNVVIPFKSNTIQSLAISICGYSNVLPISSTESSIQSNLKSVFLSRFGGSLENFHSVINFYCCA